MSAAQKVVAVSHKRKRADDSSKSIKKKGAASAQKAYPGAVDPVRMHWVASHPKAWSNLAHKAFKTMRLAAQDRAEGKGNEHSMREFTDRLREEYEGSDSDEIDWDTRAYETLRGMPNEDTSVYEDEWMVENYAGDLEELTGSAWEDDICALYTAFEESGRDFHKFSPTFSVILHGMIKDAKEE